MASCPKCNGEMTPGFAYDPYSGGRVKWIDGAPNVWRSLAYSFGIGSQPSDITSRRCGECGYIELFTDTGKKPIKTLESVEGEAAELKKLVKVLQERVGVLETIATDPAERTAREIEALRDTPSALADRSRD